jgi:hemin uptake protein HemP
MKAIFGQVVIIAILSLVLVSVYFYKTTHCQAAQVPAITYAPQADVPPAKDVKVEVTPTTPPAPQPQVQPNVVVGGAPHAIETHHGFLYRLVHPRQWRIFHRHAKVCSEVVYQPVVVTQQPVVQQEVVAPEVVRYRHVERTTVRIR